VDNSLWNLDRRKLFTGLCKLGQPPKVVISLARRKLSTVGATLRFLACFRDLGWRPTLAGFWFWVVVCWWGLV